MRINTGPLVVALAVAIVTLIASSGGAGPRTELNAERNASGSGNRVATATDMMALSSDMADGSQQLILIDLRARSIAVYQVSRGTGQLALKSVRNVHSDLQMDDFNGGSPSPQEIRSLLDHR
ncbi:MAG: hypothetical protein RIS70_4482 [Planctomycetota bacterium]|jgi:hypothetical protein